MASCTSPLRLSHRDEGGKRFSGIGHTVPCGKCIACRLNHSREWAIRIAHEAKLHDASSFLTLTYSDHCLPLDGGLSKVEFQLFMKRLRKRLEPKTLRFFGCGEYGERTARPHYHLVLFGEDFREDRKPWKTTKSGSIVYSSPLLDDVWGLGQCLIGDVTPGSAGYVARYNMKKAASYNRGEQYIRTRPDTGEVYKVEEEFLLMSRRPGIGSGWWDLYKSDAFPSDFIILNGKRMPVPRYYRLKYEAERPATDTSPFKRGIRMDARKNKFSSQHPEEKTTARRLVRDEVLNRKATPKERDFDDP